MEIIAIISYSILAILACVALTFGYYAQRQIKADNSCNDESYKKLKLYLKLMIGTYGIIIFGVIVLAIYVFIFR